MSRIRGTLFPRRQGEPVCDAARAIRAIRVLRGGAWVLACCGACASQIRSACQPDGLPVTGQSKNPATGSYDYATVAYNAATGKQRWTARYSGGPGSVGLPAAIAAGPHGSEVVVTGTTAAAAVGTQYATVAYRAATGTIIWARRYGTPPAGTSLATAVAFTPNHLEVIVTGLSGGDAATIAYRA